MTQSFTTKTLPMNFTDGAFRILILRELYRSKITLNDLKDFIDVDKLADKIENYPEPRECTQCGDGMREGYCFPEAGEYFCSDKCLRENGVSEAEMEQYFIDDVGYWTDWEYELTEEDEGSGFIKLF